MRMTGQAWQIGKLAALILGTALINCAWAQATGGYAGSNASDVAKWAYIAAALVTGCSTFAAGIAVAYVGTAAMGAMSEKPELAGRALIYVGLAEGIAIYGLIISIMILGKIQ